MSRPLLFAAFAAAFGAALGASSTHLFAQSAAPAAPAANAPAHHAAAGEKGRIAWYGNKFAGRRTASGEAYDPGAMTMAHKTLPFGTVVEVTNLANGRKVKLRVNDRGPTQADRVGDVSRAAAQALGMVRAGVVEASIVVVAEPKAKQR